MDSGSCRFAFQEPLIDSENRIMVLEIGLSNKKAAEAAYVPVIYY
jgi:hypothetical protein